MEGESQCVRNFVSLTPSPIRFNSDAIDPNAQRGDFSGRSHSAENRFAEFGFRSKNLRILPGLMRVNFGHLLFVEFGVHPPFPQSDPEFAEFPIEREFPFGDQYDMSPKCDLPGQRFSGCSLRLGSARGPQRLRFFR